LFSRGLSCAGRRLELRVRLYAGCGCPRRLNTGKHVPDKQAMGMIG